MLEDFQIFAPPQIVPGLTPENNSIAVLPAPLSHGSIGLFYQSHHPQHRSWIDGEAVGLIVETHVSAHDGNLEMLAGILETFDRQDKLPHDVRPLRISEIEAIGQSD